MGTPQIIMIVLWGLGIVLSAALHGKPKTGKHNVLGTIIATGISFGILYWGGFFN